MLFIETQMFIYKYAVEMLNDQKIFGLLKKVRPKP